MCGYIYKTTNLVNGLIYIGQKKSTKKLNYYLGSGKHLKRAIKLYGKESFKCEIIEEVNYEEDLDKREIYWIEFYNSINPDIGYNISSGGLVNRTFKGKNNPMYGKHHSKETKRKISQKQIEYNMTHDNNATKETVKLKLSKKLQNHPVSNETKNKIGKSIRNSCWVSNGKYTINITVDYLQEFKTLGYDISKPNKNIRDKNCKRKRVWVKFKNIIKTIDDKYLPDYLNSGFVRIKKPRRKAC